MQPIASTEVRSPTERHAAMTWAQRLKRVFNIDIEVCGHCGGSVKIMACIEDQDIIDRILAHLRDKELATPSLPLLTPPSRAPPETLPLFAGKDSSSTALNQQGSQRVVTAEKFVGTELFVPGFEGERKRSTRPAMQVLTAGTARACIHDLMLPRPLSGRPVTPDTPFILLYFQGVGTVAIVTKNGMGDYRRRRVTALPLDHHGHAPVGKHPKR